MDNPAVTNSNLPESSEALSPAVPTHSSNWLKVGLFGLAGLVVSVFLFSVGYWYGENSKLKTQSLKPQLETPTLTLLPTSTPTPPAKDETLDWKTYISEQNGYSIKYPPETKIYENRDAGKGVTFSGPTGQSPREFTDAFWISLAVITNSDQKTPEQLAQEYYNEAKRNLEDGYFEGDITKCKTESVVRDAITGSRFTDCTISGSKILSFTEWYVKNGITYQIYAVLQNEDYLTTFNQILSTLRFLE